jgi:hypothetical protein
VGIPRVAMDKVRFFDGADHEDIPKKCIQELLMARVLEGEIKRGANPLDPLIGRDFLLVTKTEGLDLVSPALEACKLL